MHSGIGKFNYNSNEFSQFQLGYSKCGMLLVACLCNIVHYCVQLRDLSMLLFF